MGLEVENVIDGGVGGKKPLFLVIGGSCWIIANLHANMMDTLPIVSR